MRSLKRLFLFFVPYWKTLLISMLIILARAGTCDFAGSDTYAKSAERYTIRAV